MNVDTLYTFFTGEDRVKALYRTNHQEKWAEDLIERSEKDTPSLKLTLQRHAWFLAFD